MPEAFFRDFTRKQENPRTGPGVPGPHPLWNYKVMHVYNYKWELGSPRHQTHFLGCVFHAYCPRSSKTCSGRCIVQVVSFPVIHEASSRFPIRERIVRTWYLQTKRNPRPKFFRAVKSSSPQGPWPPGPCSPSRPWASRSRGRSRRRRTTRSCGGSRPRPPSTRRSCPGSGRSGRAGSM